MGRCRPTAGYDLKVAPPEPTEADRLVAPLVDLARRGSLLVATDFDGTIAPVVRDPLRARPVPEAARALSALAEHTPVAVVSGRDLANLAAQCPVPGVLLLGSYGLEPWWRLNQGEPLPQPAEPSPRLVLLARELEDLTSWLPGIQVEVKSFGVAVHFRNSPEPRLIGPVVRRLVQQLAAYEGLLLIKGRQVIEVRPPRSGHKGVALANLLDRLRPRGCVYAGDDLGDIPAMQELHLRADQMELALALGVLSAEANPQLTEVADHLLAGPPAWARLLELVLAGVSQSAEPVPASR